jgi:predicted dinucleotide-binding enzyme
MTEPVGRGTPKEKPISYAIIGFGRIGHALAKAFARKGIEVSVAATRDPKSFAADAAAIGLLVQARREHLGSTDL